MSNILERDSSGKEVSIDEDDYYIIKDIILETKNLVQQMNTTVLDCQQAREYFSKITKTKVNETLNLVTPFYTDFGRNIHIGNNVFINHACVFMDRGGITIGNDVFIGPRVNLITTNHGIDISKRRTLTSKPIIIKNNVWIGAAATILPGVVIGENAVIGAGSVVTKDVLKNTVVAGNPAKKIRNIN